MKKKKPQQPEPLDYSELIVALVKLGMFLYAMTWLATKCLNQQS